MSSDRRPTVLIMIPHDLGNSLDILASVAWQFRAHESRCPPDPRPDN